MFAIIVLPAILLPTASLSGCADIDGGAVELNWELRCNSALCCPVSVIASDIAAGNTDECKELAQRMTCEEAGIISIEFTLNCIDSTCQESYVFPCNDFRGQTDFEIAEENYEITIDVIAEDMTAENTTANSIFSYIAPPVIEREITDGNLSDLGVLAILVESNTP